VLLYNVMHDRWGWSAPLAMLTSGVFLAVDFAFFAANLVKIAEGGWIPLTFGAIVFILMTTWHSGIDVVRQKLGSMTEPSAPFFEWLLENKIPRVPGAAVFLTRETEAIPPSIIQHVAQMGALHETLITLTVRFEEGPRVAPTERLEIIHECDGF